MSLTSYTAKTLLATGAGYNAISMWNKTGAGNAITGNADGTSVAVIGANASNTIAIGANTPAFVTAIPFPSVVPNGASALTISLAAATVMATLF